jgi:hypothetical protein
MAPEKIPYAFGGVDLDVAGEQERPKPGEGGRKSE